jgi:hypothetical protein
MEAKGKGKSTFFEALTVFSDKSSILKRYCAHLIKSKTI